MQQQIYSLIEKHLQNLKITFSDILINDISYKHAGHMENTEESHYNVTVKSEQLAGMKVFEKHKILNDAVSPLVLKNAIHAISFSVEYDQ